MDDVIALRRNNEAPLNLGTQFSVNLGRWARNIAPFTIEQFIPALKATTTLTNLIVAFGRFDSNFSTPENKRRFFEPLCRCIANLRRHNQNHPLRQVALYEADNVDNIDRFLVSAKQFGIHGVEFINSFFFSIQSIVEFCRDNRNLRALGMYSTHFFDDDLTISVSGQQDGPLDSSVIIALDELVLSGVTFKNSSAASKFLNFMAHVTYTALYLGDITAGGDEVSEEEEKVARMRIVSELIKPSVEQLTLQGNCRIEVMDVIEACATVTQIELSEEFPPFELLPAAVQVKVQQKLPAVTARNNELARFRANPRAYPGNELLALMRQFDNSPTGRFMLARCFPGIPSFFKIKITDSPTAGPKKRRRRY